MMSSTARQQPPDGHSRHSMPDSLERTAPHCLYIAQAPPALVTFPPKDGIRVETIVVGGGYVGLSTALHLAERGRSVTLLEAREPGWGAAGRNGGQVNAGFKREPDAVLRDFGPTHGPQLVRFALDGPRRLFEIIKRLQIDCRAVRCGTLRAIHAPKAVGALHAAAEQWCRHGAEVEVWDAGRVAAETGTTCYVAGLYDPRGGSVNPLALARGLAVAAQRAGAAIHARTPVLALTTERAHWRVRTPFADLYADHVVIATQAYSDELWPGLRRSLVPAFSSIVATEPMPAELARTVLPGRQVVYEGGHVTAYFRRDSENRLLMGGRGVQREAVAQRDYRHLIRYAQRLWPSLRELRWTHWWNGQLALTADFYPRFHAPSPGLFILSGFARGIALGAAFGTELAALVSGGDVNDFPLPVSEIRPITLHRFWRAGIAFGVLKGRILDRRDRRLLSGGDA